MTRPPLILVRPARAAAVVLGRSQHDSPFDRQLPVRKRVTGGGAELTGPWLLRCTVVLDRGHPLAAHGPAAAARWLGGQHRQWMQGLGIAAALYEGPMLDHWACFGGRSPGEVLVRGRKITAIAQAWRRRSILLSAGTLITRPPWTLLCSAMLRPDGDAGHLASGTTALSDWLVPRPDTERLANGLQTAIHLGLARVRVAQVVTAWTPTCHTELHQSRQPAIA